MSTSSKRDGRRREVDDEREKAMGLQGNGVGKAEDSRKLVAAQMIARRD